MVEWEIGLGWLMAALLAAFIAPLADAQHARPIGFAPTGRFMDGAPNDPPVIAGWPPGPRTNAPTNTGPPAALWALSA